MVKCIHGSSESLGTREWEKEGEGIVQDDSFNFFFVFGLSQKIPKTK